MKKRLCKMILTALIITVIIFVKEGSAGKVYAEAAQSDTEYGYEYNVTYDYGGKDAIGGAYVTGTVSAVKGEIGSYTWSGLDYDGCLKVSKTRWNCIHLTIKNSLDKPVTIQGNVDYGNSYTDSGFEAAAKADGGLDGQIIAAGATLKIDVVFKWGGSPKASIYPMREGVNRWNTTWCQINFMPGQEVQKIKKIDATVKLPKAGTKITDTLEPEITFGEGSNCKKSFSMFINCYPSEGTYDDGAIIGKTIEAGKEYYVEVYLSPKEGYEFDDSKNIELKVNGGTDYELGYCYEGQFAFFTKVMAEEGQEEDDKKEDDKQEDKQDDKQEDNEKDKKEDKKEDKQETPKYSNEWVDGKWYNADGTQTYDGKLEWKSNETGWWIDDGTGWFPVDCWQKIDGKWYFFTAEGYMDYSEYRDGCWLGADGAWDEAYSGGHWMSDSTGWWYTDAAGWYPVSQYLWIDGVKYWFGASGYWE